MGTLGEPVFWPYFISCLVFVTRTLLGSFQKMARDSVYPNGDKIKQLRDQRGWIQLELAVKTDLSTEVISRAERFFKVDKSTISRIAKELDVPVQSLIAVNPDNIELACHDHRKLTIDGTCQTTVEYVYRIVGSVEAISDTFGKTGTPDRTVVRRPEIDIATPEIDGSNVTYEFEPADPKLVKWRFLFTPPLTDSDKDVRLKYSFSLPEWWKTSAEMLRKDWADTKVEGSIEYYVDKDIMGRRVESSCRLLDLSIEFPPGFAIVDPDVLVLTPQDFRDHRVTKLLQSNGSFRKTTDAGVTTLQLKCPPPAPGWYYITWRPAN